VHVSGGCCSGGVSCDKLNWCHYPYICRYWCHWRHPGHAFFPAVSCESWSSGMQNKSLNLQLERTISQKKTRRPCRATVSSTPKSYENRSHRCAVVSTLQGGCFFGSLIAYYIADKWGRKVCYSEELQRNPNIDKIFSPHC